MVVGNVPFPEGEGDSVPVLKFTSSCGCAAREFADRLLLAELVEMTGRVG